MEAVPRSTLILPEETELSCAGLTSGPCVSQGGKNGTSFRTETYSFLVNPFPDWSSGEGVRICKAFERDITVNSASIQFLQSSKFNFRALLCEGLGYLNYDEEKKVKDFINGPRRNRTRKLEKR